MKSIIKRFFVSVMALAIALAGIQVSPMKADAASTTSRIPISCYTLGGRVTTYTTQACTTASGYIDSVDLTKIKAFYSEYSSVQVEYPTSRGQKTAYAKVSAFFQDVNFSTSTGKTGKNLTAYKRSTGIDTIGTVYATDICIATGYANGRTQLVYPVGNGSTFKMGWVSGTYSFNSGSSSSGLATVSNGTYTLVSALNNNYVADIAGGSSESQANCQLYQNNGTNAQKFTLIYNADGYYTIKNVGSGKVLDCAGAGSANGTNVWQYDSNLTSAQKWKITAVGNGYYTIICKCNGKCLDVSGGNVYNGNNIQIYESNGTNSQKWKLVSTSANTSQYTYNALSTNGITYAPYTGVNFTNVGLSSQRVAALQRAVKLATVQWTSPATFRTWQASNGTYNTATATDGTPSYYFVQGKTYQGIPYSMADHSYDDEKWNALVKDKEKFTSKYMTTSYNGRSATTAHGIDCSYLTYLCFNAARTGVDVPYQNTSAMLYSSYYVIKRNGLNEIKGGDILLKNGHVMMYVGKADNKYAVIEANANDSRVCYNTYTSGELSSYKVYKFRGFSD